MDSCILDQKRCFCPIHVAFDYRIVDFIINMQIFWFPSSLKPNINESYRTIMFSIFNVPCYVKEFPTATANYRSHLLMLKLISSVFICFFLTTAIVWWKACFVRIPFMYVNDEQRQVSDTSYTFTQGQWWNRSIREKKRQYKHVWLQVSKLCYSKRKSRKFS